MGKTSVIVDQPIYLRQAILDLSKIVMHRFHYDKNLLLCYMDTDSLVYDIETNDFYKGIADNFEARFHKSSYSQNPPLPIGVNKKVIGLMNHELGGRVNEFVALRPKLYTYKTLSILSSKPSGTKKCMVNKTLDSDDYRHCLFTGIGQSENVYQKQLMFWNRPHEVYTFKVNKVALNRDDGKRVIQKMA